MVKTKYYLVDVFCENESQLKMSKDEFEKIKKFLDDNNDVYELKIEGKIFGNTRIMTFYYKPIYGNNIPVKLVVKEWIE